MGAAAFPIAIGAQAAGGLYSAWAQGQAGLAQSSYYSGLAETSRLNAQLAKTAGEVNAAINAEKARGNALGHQSGGYRPNLDDLSEAELEQVARGEWPERLRIA